MKRRNQVGAVIHRDMRFEIERLVDMLVIGLVVFAVDGKDGDAVIFHQRSRDIILRGKRIGRAQYGIGAAGLEGDHQVGGLGRHMQTAGHSLTPLSGFSFANRSRMSPKDRHICSAHSMRVSPAVPASDSDDIEFHLLP